MKKLNMFFTALMGLGLVACTETFGPEAGPQSNLPESLLKESDITVVNVIPDVIDLANYIDEESSTETPVVIGVAEVAEGAMPANTILKAAVEVSRDADFATSTVIEANSMETQQEISIQPSVLEDAYFNEITKNPSTTQLYMRTILYTLTNNDQLAIVGKPGECFFAEKTVEFTPLNRLTIAPAYYIVGGPNDWAASAAERTIKFNHSDEDVYIDPVFTVVFDANDGDTWFAIGDDVACDAISAGDWSQLYGIVGGDNEAKEGKIARRNEMGGDNSFKVPAGAKKIRVTIDMMEQTFKVEAVNIAENYYLVGGNGSWGSSKTQVFTHSNKDVFDDPIFSYVLTGGSELWFAFGDAEALDAIDSGDWTQLFGTKGESEDLSGSYDRRSNLGGDHSFHVDGSAKFYRFTINALNMTYEIVPLNFQEYIYFIGATDGWNNDEPNRQRLALTDDSGIYTGYIYMADPNGWGNEFKFQKEKGDWGTEVNTGQMTSISGDIVDGGGNFKANAGEGVYFVKLDLSNNTIEATRINNMNLVGDFNGWNAADDAQQMTWNATDYCYEITGAAVTSNGWKFTANNEWKINLGGAHEDLVADGSNLWFVGTTIKLYPTRRTNDKIFCTVE